MHNFQNSNSLERKVGICKRAEDTIVLVIRVAYAQWWHWELPAVISLHHQQLWTLIIYWHLGIQQCQSRTGMFTYTAQTTKSNKCFEESKKKQFPLPPSPPLQVLCWERDPHNLLHPWSKVKSEWTSPGLLRWVGCSPRSWFLPCPSKNMKCLEWLTIQKRLMKGREVFRCY